MVRWAQAPIQPVTTSIPALPWPLLSNPNSSPSPSPGLIGVPPPGDAERHSPISFTQDLSLNVLPFMRRTSDSPTPN